MRSFAFLASGAQLLKGVVLKYRRVLNLIQEVHRYVRSVRWYVRCSTEYRGIVNRCVLVSMRRLGEPAMSLGLAFLRHPHSISSLEFQTSASLHVQYLPLVWLLPPLPLCLPEHHDRCWAQLREVYSCKSAQLFVGNCTRKA